MTDLPDLADLLQSAVPFALPLLRPFRGTRLREGVLLPGPRGWGEFAPFDDYPDAAAGRWLDAAIEAAYLQVPAPRRESVTVNAIVPACDAATAAMLTLEARARGCTTVKVKVGDARLDDDVARVAAVRSVLGADGAIRIDANAGWTLDEAAVALAELEQFGLEYAEQPCATQDLRALRSRTSVALAVDEGIRASVQAMASVGGSQDLRELADIAILKPQTLGGVAATLRMVERVGMPVVISGSLDSSVGLSAVVAAAAAVPDLPRASGLGTGALLAADVTTTPLLPADGRLAVGRVAPQEQALAAARDRVPGPRTSYWRVRLESAWAARARLSG